ncbi:MULTISPECIES: DUF397 domain-containing protein [Actinoplanes]|uniref:DUF397 domain-containing protein n=1 Tax=Actinoplanes TaxID=1865 RepID=UPI0005F28DBA|nr:MULTISPECIES: DUF397 domain-containing protein [Actinoplanes]GLY00643.1 transcriptional regulator [Actinoplanes sp. NBRC 101535]
MTRADFSREELTWRVATKSASLNCVEIAKVDQDTIAVRNSRRPDGDMVVYTTAEFDAFVDGVKRGEFDDFLR